MLGKLLKYELQSLIKKMWPLYVVLFCCSIGSSLICNSLIPDLAEYHEDLLLFRLFTLILYGLIIALGVVTFVQIVNRFRKSLLGREGYLLFTLPVSVNTHLISKIISVVILGIMNSFVYILSIVVVLFITPELSASLAHIFSFDSLVYAINEIAAEFGVSTGHLILTYILLCIEWSAYFILIIYFSLVLGHLSNKNKFLRSVLIYIGINMVVGIIFQIGLVSFVVLVQNVVNLDIMPILDTLIAIGVLLVSGLYFGTWYLLKNKLNLE